MNHLRQLGHFSRRFEPVMIPNCFAQRNREVPSLGKQVSDFRVVKIVQFSLGFIKGNRLLHHSLLDGCEHVVEILVQDRFTYVMQQSGSEGSLFCYTPFLDEDVAHGRAGKRVVPKRQSMTFILSAEQLDDRDRERESSYFVESKDDDCI